MTGSFPARVPAGASFRGAVTVTNKADAPVQRTAAAQPDVFVCKEGAIVASPLARDDVGVLLELAPGEGRVFDARGSLLGCRDGRPLAPGRYEIHAVLQGVGASAGGPWPLTVE